VKALGLLDFVGDLVLVFVGDLEGLTLMVGERVGFAEGDSV
jgi:hypothetical protein